MLSKRVLNNDKPAKKMTVLSNDAPESTLVLFICESLNRAAVERCYITLTRAPQAPARDLDG